MNILFFLTPKAMCANVDADDTLREAMERMESAGFSALPILNRDGSYAGVLTEGDLLWALKRLCSMDMRCAEQHGICEITPRRAVQAVTVNTRIEDLLSVVAEQNFVPVVDDRGMFVGIVTRKSILNYYREKIKNFP